MTMQSSETVTNAQTESPSAETTPAAAAVIQLTDRAAEKVREIASAEGLAGQGLRVQVKGGGCAGFQYDLYFDEKPGDMDQILESKGVQLYIDMVSLQYLEQTEIDYVETLTGAGFKFNNPNSKGSCGCGSSFSV